MQPPDPGSLPLPVAAPTNPVDVLGETGLQAVRLRRSGLRGLQVENGPSTETNRARARALGVDTRTEEGTGKGDVQGRGGGRNTRWAQEGFSITGGGCYTDTPCKVVGCATLSISSLR